MLFEKLLFPSEMRSSYEDLTPEYLHSIGKKYIVSDIDNTLVTYDDEKPTERLLRWLRMMEQGGVTIAFISNNTKERVDLFNNELGYVAWEETVKVRFFSEISFSRTRSALIARGFIRLSYLRYATKEICSSVQKDSLKDRT